MAIKTIEEKKKQQKLLILLGVIVLIAFIILYFGYLKKNTVNVSNVPQQVTNTEENGLSGAILRAGLEKTNLNVDYLNQVIFSFLRSHGDLPVKRIVTGRNNPFIPQ